MKIKSITAILLAVMLFACGCQLKVSEFGDNVVIKTEHCYVTDAMLEYMFYSNFYDLYGNSPEYYNLDLNLTFSEQMYSKGVSWQEHLSELALANAKRDTLLMEDGLAEGFEYSDLKNDIDLKIGEYAENAEALGMSLENFFKAYFGEKATEQVARSALEIQLYASEYAEMLKREYSKDLSEEDYSQYYEENKMDIEIVDVLMYSIPINYNGIINTEKRDSLLSCKTEEEFKQWIANDLTEKNNLRDDPQTPEELEEKIKEKTAVVMSHYTKGGEFSEWAFAEDTKLGDTHYTEKNTGMYDIYMLVRKPHAYEKYTHNVGQILLTDNNYATVEEAADAAERIIEEFNSGGGTASAFEELAEEYNEDEICFSYNVADDFFSGDEAKAWLKSGDRKEGDITALLSDNGYYIIYYAGQGMQRWMAEATDNLTEAFMDEYLNELEKEYSDTLTVKENITDDLPDSLSAGAIS